MGPEFRINTFTTADQAQPSLASDASGNFVVVWQSDTQDGQGAGVFGQRYASSGSPLGAEFRVNTYVTSSQAIPSVAMDVFGNFVVVWNSPQDGVFSLAVIGQRYASSGVPLGSEFRVNTYTTGNQRLPSIATDSFSNFVVVWAGNGQDGSRDGVFGQRFANSGGPVGPEFRVNTWTTDYQYWPAIAADAAGNFVVVWQSYGEDGSTWGIFAQRYASSGVPLGPEFRVNTYTTNSQVFPSVARAPSGNFVIAWQSRDQDGSVYGVYAQRYTSSGTTLGAEFRVNTFVTTTQALPSVSVDQFGNFVVVWADVSQDGSGVGVFGQRFASSGAPLGPEFRVNTYTTNSQIYPSVSARPAGEFVVVWESGTQDGSNGGVFAQRFSQIVPVELIDVRIE